jgi:hypothetical protein
MEPCEETWIDFTPRTNSQSIGHYLPIHEAWNSAAEFRKLNWQVISNSKLISQKSILKTLQKMISWPTYFTAFDLLRFAQKLSKMKSTKIKILVYEGEFVSFYFFLFLSRIIKQPIEVHFNWSNNNQLLNYSKKKFLYKIHFNMLNFASDSKFVFYVENPILQKILNVQSKMNFLRFPTSTVFDQSFANTSDIKENKIALIINDKLIDQKKFVEICKWLDSNFRDFDISVFTYHKYILPYTGKNNYSIYTEQLGRNEYYKVLAGTSKSFFFYNESNYKYLTSGRFLDCQFVGSQIYVPIESEALDWMGLLYGNFEKVGINVSGFGGETKNSFTVKNEKKTNEITPEHTIDTLVANSVNKQVRIVSQKRKIKLLRDILLILIFSLISTKFLILLIKNVYTW